MHPESLSGKILSAQFSKHKETVLPPLFKQGMCYFKYIMVIGTGKPFVCRYHNVTDFLFRYRNMLCIAEINAFQIRRMTKNTLECLLQRIKIRFGICQFFLCLLQLCRRDHIHRIRDLHGILDTFHTLLYFLRICHARLHSLCLPPDITGQTQTCCYLFCPRNSSATDRICSLRSSSSTLSVWIFSAISGCRS